MTESQLELLKAEAEAITISPISSMMKKNKKIYLFYSMEEQIEYSLYTDGSAEHLDTWLDKKPGDQDLFLEFCRPRRGYIKRFEFQIEDANILLLEKRYQERKIYNLYINQEDLYKIINNYIYRVSISPTEKIKIKKMEKII